MLNPGTGAVVDVLVGVIRRWRSPTAEARLCQCDVQQGAFVSVPTNLCGTTHSCVIVQSLHRVRLFATPWSAACQASLYITNSQSLLKLMSTELVMPSNYLILCHPLLLLPSLFPSIRVFSNDSALHIS